jgi:hypothetical protein
MVVCVRCGRATVRELRLNRKNGARRAIVYARKQSLHACFFVNPRRQNVLLNGAAVASADSAESVANRARRLGRDPMLGTPERFGLCRRFAVAVRPTSEFY